LPEALAAAGVPSLTWPAVREPGSTSTAEVLRLRGLVAAVRPDVVHLHSAKAGLAGRLALRGRRRTLFQPHGWSWLASTGPVAAATLRWERVAARWTDVLVCVGDGEAAAGREARLRGRYAVVRNGVDLARFTPGDRAGARAGLGLPANAPVVVCVGRVTRQKGQDLLLAAWPAVTAVRPDALLLIVGAGDLLPTLRDTPPGGVRFAGDVADPRPWYAAADLVVQPSRWEGLPFTVLEALASGRPVVATAVPGIRDVLAAESTVAPGDVAALARAITARLADPARLAAESTRAARHARGFDLRITLDELAELTAGVRSRQRAELSVEQLVPAPRQGRR
jgi:glycosyltransferase involved in cell wall biosynthesis